MPGRTLEDSLPAQAMQVYEVFRQEDPGGPMVHAGQVQAPNDELAPQYARDAYARRGETARLWVVARTAVLELTDRDILIPAFERSYKSGKGFREAVEKRKKIREKLGTAGQSRAETARVLDSSPLKQPLESREASSFESGDEDGHA